MTQLKTYAEIRDIITRQLGITDLKSYEAWGKRFCWTGNGPMAVARPPTQEDIDLLSPDAIDNGAFWRIAEELFQTDPVSNCMYTRPYDVAEANRTNLSLYHMDGFTGLVEACKLRWHPTRAPLLEIGPGYGAFKEWVAKLDYYDYYAADVYPRIEGVDATLPNGRLAEVTLARRYAIVLASNVFQHLSVRQREDYYRDIAGCLLPSGLFMVSQMVDTGGPGYRDKDGAWWCRHYGQLTQIQRPQSIFADLQRHFTLLSHTYSKNGGWLVVTCEKKG